MKKPVVLIVECLSSSINYLKDLEERGYQAAVLESPIIRKNQPSWYSYDLFGAKKPIILSRHEKYEDTLKEVRKLNPILIVTGADHGLEMCLKLSNDLGLENNLIENLPKMRDKYISQKTLKEHGIRCIESVRYTNFAKALAFFKKHNNKIVVKPAKGVSSIGVSVCTSVRQLKKSIALAQSKKNYSVTNKQPILQEFIDGEEYIVDTVSCDGIVKVSSIYHYHKKQIKGYAPVYSWTTSHSPNEKEIKPIVDYALKVVKAVGVEWGPVHGEYKVDAKGPVLIETNCRIPGGSMPNTFLDAIWGHHETNLVLDAYLEPEKFLKYPTLIRPKAFGILKHFILDKPIYIKKVTPDKAFKGIKSFHAFNMGFDAAAKNRWLHKTIDYETSGGTVFLVNKDQKQLQRDLDTLTDIEHHHLDLLYDIGIPPKSKNMNKTHLRDLVNEKGR
ncbi:MAG: ATP-grasp domain-containing protein [Mycoplasmoidaceae bacterium]